MTKLSEAMPYLRLPPVGCSQVMTLVLGRDAAVEFAPLSPADELTLLLGGWFVGRDLHWHDVLGLLKELQPLLTNLAPAMRCVWDAGNEADVPQDSVSLADGRYAVWDGQKKYWDVLASRYVDSAPQPPHWHVSVHLCGLYFLYLRAKEEGGKDAQPPTTAASPAG
jgi:hypothetical protein